jgi:hypothetical protein
MNMRHRYRHVLAALVSSAVLVGAPVAWAADDVAGAASAFSRAQRAELSGDHARAAELYELADSMAPAPEALRSALRARLAAGQKAIAAARADALKTRYPEDAESKALAEKTLADLGAQLGRFEVTCRPRACNVIVDGEAAGTDAQTSQVIYLEPGSHQIAAAFGSLRADAQPVEVKAGESTQIAFDAPPEPVEPTPSGGSEGLSSGSLTGDVSRDSAGGGGLSPAWFAVGAIVTAGVGAAAIWSGIDTLNQRDEYDKNRTEKGYQDGLDLERRTNVLIAGTGVAAVCTVVIAGFTNWSGSPKPQAKMRGLRVDVRGAPGGAGIGLHGSF